MLNIHALQLSIGNKHVCNALDLTVKPGEIWGIIGRNGTGKTTLLHALSGLIKPDSGKITLKNKALDTISPVALSKNIALLLQDNNFSFPIRVNDVISTGRYPYRKDNNNNDDKIISEALTITELSPLKNRFVNTLSGGEKRRCALATVFAQTPNLYLLDEPMNHLDLVQQKTINQHLVHLAKEENASIIMSTHDINTIKTMCDHTLVLLGNGEYICGKSSTILQNLAVREKLALNQTVLVD